MTDIRLQIGCLEWGWVPSAAAEWPTQYTSSGILSIARLMIFNLLLAHVMACPQTFFSLSSNFYQMSPKELAWQSDWNQTISRRLIASWQSSSATGSIHLARFWLQPWLARQLPSNSDSFWAMVVFFKLVTKFVLFPGSATYCAWPHWFAWQVEFSINCQSGWLICWT